MTKYIVELTEEQLRVIQKCCEIYFRLMIGQSNDFADEIVRSQMDLSANNPNHKRDFDRYIQMRNHIEKIMNAVFSIALEKSYPLCPSEKTNDVLVAQDIWDAFREFRINTGYPAIQLSNQPLPRIVELGRESKEGRKKK